MFMALNEKKAILYTQLHFCNYTNNFARLHELLEFRDGLPLHS